MTTRHRLLAVQAFSIAAVLVVSTLAGRQLFQDGVNFVVHSLQEPGWFPQPTPRRFFAVVWSTGLIRLLGRLDAEAVVLGSLLFGLLGFAQIAVPATAILTARLASPIQSLLLAAFLSGAMLIANFVVSELLFAYALTTLFVVFTLDPSRDPKAWIRFVCAGLLVASYEVIAVSNLFLALGAWLSAGSERRPAWSKVALVALLLAGPAFQVFWYGVNPQPGVGAAKDLRMYPIVAGSVTLAGLLILAFRSIGRWPLLRALVVLAVLAAPLALLVLPDTYRLRTVLFELAYPSRFYTMCVLCFIALVPALLGQTLWNGPRRLLDWIGETALSDLASAMTALFCSLSLLASLDAYLYRTRLDAALSELSGVVAVRDCAFCVAPESFGAPDLSFTWTWPLFGIAHTLHRPDAPPVVVLNDPQEDPRPTYPYERAQVDAFLRDEAARRQAARSDGAAP